MWADWALKELVNAVRTGELVLCSSKAVSLSSICFLVSAATQRQQTHCEKDTTPLINHFKTLTLSTASNAIPQYYYGYPTLMTPVHAPFPSMNVSEWAFWTLLRSRHSINVSIGCRATAVARGTADTSRVGRVDFLCANDTEHMSISASYIIDATYDGDIMTMVGGIDYTSGREPRFV